MGNVLWTWYHCAPNHRLVLRFDRFGACPTVERSTILIHVRGSLHCWTTQRQWSDPRFVDWFLASIHVAEITWLCVYIALLLLLLLLIKMAEKAIININCRCKQMLLLFDVSKWNVKFNPWVFVLSVGRRLAGESLPFLSASLYVSKRGAYWDRLCRDVVGRWLVVTRVHCGQTVHPRPIVTMEL